MAQHTQCMMTKKTIYESTITEINALYIQKFDTPLMPHPQNSYFKK